MARHLKWTESAWADLEEIADYIARDSRYYAATFVRELQTAASSLGRLAERGRRVPEFDDPSVREIFVRRYRIIYKLSSEIPYKRVGRKPGGRFASVGAILRRTAELHGQLAGDGLFVKPAAGRVA